MVLEKTLESPLDCKEIQLAHYEGDQPWDFFGRNDAEAETPVFFGHLMQRVDSLEKTLMLGGTGGGGGEEKGTTKDEIAGWHHPLDGHEFECCDSWGLKESDTTERLN